MLTKNKRKQVFPLLSRERQVCVLVLSTLWHKILNLCLVCKGRNHLQIAGDTEKRNWEKRLWRLKNCFHGAGERCLGLPRLGNLQSLQSRRRGLRSKTTCKEDKTGEGKWLITKRAQVSFKFYLLSKGRSKNPCDA